MEILYHYCSTAAFHAIVESQCLWLSSLTLSSDTMEGKLVTNTFARLAERDGLDEYNKGNFLEAIEKFGQFQDGLGFCLSEEGDLLSQWRGYAGDATGVAIGFSKEYLERLAETSKDANIAGFSLYQVDYDPSAHELQIEPIYREIKKVIDTGVFNIRRGRRFIDTRTDEEIEQEKAKLDKASMEMLVNFLPFLAKYFVLKSPAFREEREWRLLSHRVGDNDHCLYRAVHDRIIPYRKFDLKRLTCPSIVEVVLGPKHITPAEVVANFMKKRQFGLVQVRGSAASYR